MLPSMGLQAPGSFNKYFLSIYYLSDMSLALGRHEGVFWGLTVIALGWGGDQSPL